MSKSAGERSECAISHPYEREAMALLYQAGWSRGELAMTFQVGEGAVARLLVAEGVIDE
jgi:hypothetical protein